LSWYVGASHLRAGEDPEPASGAAQPTYRPWYAERFKTIEEVAGHWRAEYEGLRQRTARFSESFYDSTLPPEVIEAVAANLAILKSPTVLRQADGQLWAWEGCNDNRGCCHGSCTHVWNYAQALPHLFPALERGLRETEFNVSQDARGHQTFRAALPIRPTAHTFHAAADGQLGGVLKVYREWRISGDEGWLRRLWPRVRASLDYGIETWDPRHRGVIEEPHHNTYDIEFWGADGMCTSFYLALRAAVLMSGRSPRPCRSAALEQEGLLESSSGTAILRAEGRVEEPAREEPARDEEHGGELLARGDALVREGGTQVPVRRGLPLGRRPRSLDGCGVRGPGLPRHGQARLAPRGRPPPQLQARPARAREPATADLRLRRRGRPAAVHLAARRSPDVAFRLLERGVDRHRVPGGVAPDASRQSRAGARGGRACRGRYDGRPRAPFDEYECGHWYARAMASYALRRG
jgi:hypothetical protein